MSIQISQSQVLRNALEFASQNHRVISQNMANLNTPGYQSLELLAEQLATGASQHLAEFQTKPVEGLQERPNGNNVDLDTEMSNMRRNDLVYQTLTQLLGAKVDMLKTAIKG
ncbi:MAG: flagellar basal body protein [Pirellulaceae bacterium]